MMVIPKWGNYPGDGGGGITLVIDRSASPKRFAAPRRMATRSRSAPVSVNALIRSSPGISSGKLANLANSVSEKIDATH